MSPVKSLNTKFTSAQSMARKLVFCACLLSLIVAISASTDSYAIDDSDIKATDQIRNNPAAMDILRKIELSKQILAEMQETKKVKEQQALKIQEARRQAQADLDAELSRMNKDAEPYSAKNAFERFVAKKPTEVHSIFWSMFNYQQEKIKAAQQVRSQILLNGGTEQQAWDAYRSESSMKRTEMIQLNKEYNIHHANSNAAIQQSFDKNGKLPRSD